MKTALFQLLQVADEPVVAADLANDLWLEGSRETKRRKIRALVKELRDDGNWIVATIFDGYWLTHDYSLWRDYNEGKKIEAKRIFAEVSRRKKYVELIGQGKLF